jgi:PPIC-type PPIASE domain
MRATDRRASALFAAAILALACDACGSSAPPAPVAQASLGGAVARVGTIALSPALVAGVARARGSSPREATADLIADALAAQGAQARGLDRDPVVAGRCAAALARRVPERLAEEAKASGPPSEDELEVVSVVQAMVVRSATIREEDALALAGELRRAVTGASSSDDFEARAGAVLHPHVQVSVQTVGPFGADGQGTGQGEVDPSFVAAAFALRSPLDVSPIVETPFGWHVLRLVERKAAEISPVDRPRALEGAVVGMRGRLELDALLRARKQATKIEVSPGADTLMTRVTAEP